MNNILSHYLINWNDYFRYLMTDSMTSLFGKLLALSEISLPHSGYLISAIKIPPLSLVL